MLFTPSRAQEGVSASDKPLHELVHLAAVIEGKRAVIRDLKARETKLLAEAKEKIRVGAAQGWLKIKKKKQKQHQEEQEQQQAQAGGRESRELRTGRGAGQAATTTAAGADGRRATAAATTQQGNE